MTPKGDSPNHKERIMSTAREITARITITEHRKDPYQVLVRDNDGYLEYLHPQTSDWMTLPESWVDQAKTGLHRATHATHAVSISQYSFGKETEYVTYRLPLFGDEAKAFLQEEMAKGHRRSVSPWQYGRRHETASEVERAILDGRYDDAVRIGRADLVEA